MNVCGAMLAGATVFALASAAVAQGRPPATKAAEERAVNLCSTCHGKDAAGNGNIPRLAGQHAKYVAKQLNYIQTLVRAAPVMHGIIKDLKPSEMQAVAAYVQSR